MARRKTNDTESTRKVRPALTPEARENQMIAYAVDLAEQQLLDGTASSQVITHFLKLGTEKYKLELEKIRHENNLSEAKTESIQSAKRVEELYANALEAMRNYNGMGSYEDD